ncbi:hypothetical protein BWQ96_07812 [Gracilariopsis chorda]|uniref:RNase H type-1 domain-containing protein n=1 Tax=Gracilariopsis chorda TaxID=448386 RepID=A0A2V3IK49_9FLOR|nr:hypothetical protein BWQ96_07812 [Gracilariopsis chorda]|eukprot:PXF42474.1 hypothetical protein BWQ96_07812 [Gracilariopsis chorda]
MKGSFNVSVLVFADASRPCEYGQLGYIYGLLFGDIRSDSVLHTLLWSSRKSRSPVKFIGSAEILAAGAAIDEGKRLVKALTKLFNMDVFLSVIVDSTDLFDTLSTCRNALDRSIRAAVSVIRYEFENQNVNHMVWVPANCNLADSLTKLNSPLNQALELLLFLANSLSTPPLPIPVHPIGLPSRHGLIDSVVSFSLF